MTTAAGRAAARSGAVTPSLVAAAADRVAAPSAVVQATLDLLADERSSMRQVAERVGQSPEVALHVMRLASSPVFGGPAETLDQAVVRIGADSLRALLMAAATYPLLKGSLTAYGLPAMALLRRANDVAAVARTLAERSEPAGGAQAYAAGLLHDIGMPILAAVAEDAGLDGGPTLADVAAERERFGTDHARVGAWISHRWGLSGDLADAVHRHHDEACPEGRAAQAVWLAAMIVDARTGDAVAAERVVDAATGLAVDDATLEALLMGDDQPGPAPEPAPITAREFEVLSMLAAGLAPKQVARELGCSPSTVHNHLHHVYRKLGVSGQAQALLLARERGWV